MQVTHHINKPTILHNEYSTNLMAVPSLSSLKCPVINGVDYSINNEKKLLTSIQNNFQFLSFKKPDPKDIIDESLPARKKEILIELSNIIEEDATGVIGFYENIYKTCHQLGRNLTETDVLLNSAQEQYFTEPETTAEIAHLFPANPSKSATLTLLF